MKLILNSLICLLLFNPSITFSAPEQNFAPLEKVSLQLKWLHAFQFAGYYAAQEKGFYAAEGLNVEIKVRIDSIDYVAQVVKGESNYGIADSSLLLNRLKGQPVMVLASIFQHNPYAYASLKSSGIVSPYEIKGKRVMEESNGTSSVDAPLQAMLYEAGISKQDYTHVNSTYNYDALINGETDVFPVYLTDVTYYYREKHIDINIIDPRNYGIDFLGDNLFTTEQEISQHPQRTQRFLRASLKGWEYALKHPEEIVQLILRNYNADHRLSADFLRAEAAATAKMILPDSIPLGSSSIERFQRMAETYQELGMVQSIDNLKGFIYQPVLRSKLNLSLEEKHWLQTHPDIHLAIDKDFPPYEFTDDKGLFIGLSADYIALVEQRLGMKFHIITDKPWAEMLNMARRGDIDLLSDIVQTPERSHYLLFTEPYVDIPAVIISDKNNSIRRLDELNGKRVAVESSYFMYEILVNTLPDIQVIPVNNTVDALAMVSSGEVNAYIGDAASTNYTIGKEGMTSLFSARYTDYKNRHRMAVIKAHPLLKSILDKALADISDNEKQTIHNRWLSLQAKHGIDTKIIVRYGVAILAIFLVIMLWNMVLQREIKQRKQIEKSLLESEKLLRESQVVAGLGSYVLNVNTGMWKGSKMLETLLGIDETYERSLEAWLALIHPADRARVDEYLKKEVFGQGKGFNAEYRIIRPNDHAERWIHGIGKLEFDSQGNIQIIHGTKQDITERKYNAEALQQSANQIAMLMNSVAEGIYGVDKHGNCTFINAAGLQLLGYQHETELLGKQMHDLIHHTYWDGTPYPVEDCRLYAAFRTNESIHVNDEVFWHKNGHSFPVDYWSRPTLLNDETGAVVTFVDVTERKQAEAKLKQSRDELLHYFEQPLIGMVTSHIDTQMLHVNQRFCDIVGYSKEEMQTLNWTAISHPEDLAIDLAYFNQILRGEINSYQMEKRYIHKEGQWVYTHLAVDSVRDARGQVDYLIGMVLDISERKLAEKELNKTNVFFQSLAEISPVGIYRTDAAGNCIFVNRKGCELIDMTPEQAKTTGWSHTLMACDKEKVYREWQLAVQEQRRFELEYRYQHADGKIVWVYGLSALIHDESGAISGYVGTITDITERKQAEMELRIAATVFESQEGMIITNTQNIILNVNHAFTLITGYSKEDVIGKTPRLLSSGKHDEHFYNQLRQTIQDTGSWQGEIWDRRKNGEIYPQWLTITAVKSNDKKTVSHYVATMIDITERKITEERINQLAFYDSLTQLPNRRLLHERLKHGIELSQRTGNMMAVLTLDLDKFKAVNDSFGHAAGDELLQQVAERIKVQVDEMDTVARLGGDEFIVLLENIIQHDQVIQVANNIIHTLEQPFSLSKNHEARIGTSIGIALYPQHGNTIEALMDNSDAALYHAKDNGRGCFSYFSSN